MALAATNDADTAATEDRVRRLSARHDGSDAEELIAAMVGRAFAGRIALVSSFGAEAAVLLHMVARADAGTPVIFLDTGKLFGETHAYRDRLVARLCLTDVRTVEPAPARRRGLDPDGTLWSRDPKLCCTIRKVEPLRRALAGFDAWISGRKALHGGERGGIGRFEAVDGRIKINPLADWDKAAIEAYFARHGLPRHPLEAEGYLSVGCVPCTDRVAPGEPLRAGRWRGRAQSECGIHLAAPPVPLAAAQNR